MVTEKYKETFEEVGWTALQYY